MSKHRLPGIPGHTAAGDPTRPPSAYLPIKRIIDIVIVTLLAPFVLVVVGVLAALVRIDGGKAFFCQPRVGKDGTIFKLWKLRTMVPDAEQKLREHLTKNPQARSEWTVRQKLEIDPRITPLGKYLRKYSLDELPQLLNVFLGHMSLVGPRPMLPEQRLRYPGVEYFNLRPGLTGLWQISERNGCTFAERALLDTRYSGMMSLRTDLWILSRTPLVVLRGTGL